jgi:predicted amidohydrolase YtcJ
LANWEGGLRAAVRDAEPGQWILLSSDWGSNFEYMPELFPRFLPQISRQRLDELAPDNPVRIKNSWVDGLVNTRALEEIARIFPDQKIEGRGNRGPTGRQLEPDIMLHNKVELNAELLESEMELWAAHGVTVYGSSPYTIGNLNALRILDEEGRMPGRFAWSYTGPDLHYQTIRLVSALLGNGSDYLWNIGAHGERSGGNCTTLPASERVKAQESCRLEPGDDGRRVKEDIVRSGGRIGAMHSGGDLDIDHLLDVIETKSIEAGLSLEEIRERRHAFDHASGAPRPDQIPRIKRLGMYVSMINTVIWENRTGYDASYRLRNYGEEYIGYAVPRNSVTKAGIMNTQEVDRALPHFLFYNLWAGMTRYNSGIDRTLAPEEGTDLMTQLKALTIWGAYYVLREDRLGSLEQGKLADFVVLDQDLLSVSRDDIPQVKVLMTVIGGKTVRKDRKSRRNTCAAHLCLTAILTTPALHAGDEDISPNAYNVFDPVTGYMVPAESQPTAQQGQSMTATNRDAGAEATDDQADKPTQLHSWILLLALTFLVGGYAAWKRNKEQPTV